MVSEMGMLNKEVQNKVLVAGGAGFVGFHLLNCTPSLVLFI